MKRLTILFTLFVFVGFQLIAQEVITGTVTSQEDGNPVPGVSIIVKGTIIGTITDADGNYSLSVPEDARILVFTFVGMKTVEETIGDRSTIDIILEIDVFGLEEVVVTGYMTQMRESLTGSVATIQADELAKVPASNIVRRMQGRIAGVTILNAHTPGGEATVRIRGLGSINDNDPLYVIDNVPTRGGLSQVNPNDIESISVLKDAASTGIYGARGANGVIIITTKRGKPGKPKITFTARGGINQAATKPDLLNTQEYGELQWLEAKNDGVAPGNATYGFGSEPVIPDYFYPAGTFEGDPAVDPALYSYPSYLIMRANKEGTDWFDETTHNGSVSEYNLSISGGTESNSYAFSTGYMREESIFLHMGFERYSIRSNVDAKFKNWLTIGETFGLSYTTGWGDMHIENGERSIVTAINAIQPIVPVYDIGGNFAGAKVTGTGRGHPVAALTRNKNDIANTLRVIGNTYAQVNIIEGLNFRSLIGIDYTASNSRGYDFKTPADPEPTIIDALSNSSGNRIQWNWINTLNYNKSFADIHKLNAVIGTEAVSSTQSSFSASRTDFFIATTDYMILNAGEGLQTNYGSGTEWRTFSYFGRLNYDLAGKYLAQLTLRSDGSSRFGKNERWANFPAVSIGWMISKENFMAGTQNWLDYLKLRVGWGQSGNDLIGNYNGFTTFRSDLSHTFYGLEGNNTSSSAGFDSNTFGNPDAKWETITTTNVGIDATFSNVSLNVDVWQRNTSDMLYPLSIPDVVGQAVPPSINIGDMKNTGFDVVLSYRGSAAGGDFKYNISANVSHYKNEIIKLSDNELETIYGGKTEATGYNCRAEIGRAFPEFYGYIVDGIFQNQVEADAHPPAFGQNGTYNAPGHFKYRDVNGDGVIDIDDRAYIGSPHPDFIAGLNFEMEYKSFDLTAFFYTSYGNELVNDVKRWVDYIQYQGNRSHDRLYNSWGSPYLDNNEDAILAIADHNAGSTEPSDHFVEDASYLRLKNLQLGYTLPESAANKLKLSSLRIYLQGTNLFTITKYSGLDPECRARFKGINMGVDMGAWPTYRTFMLGISIGI